MHDKLYDNVKIIHFITFKPWEYSGRIFLGVDEFWKYYQLTPWFFDRPIDAIQTILAQKYYDYENTKLKINDIKCFGIYHHRNTLQIVFFFIKITIEMSFKNVNKIASIVIRIPKITICKHFELVYIPKSLNDYF